mgnify:FL=1
MQSNIVKKEGEYKVEHVLDDDDFCGWCQITVNEKNSVVFDVCSNDFEDTKVYCKACASIFLKDFNIKICESWSIPVCHACGKPKKKECKCSIGYNLRKKLK